MGYYLRAFCAAEQIPPLGDAFAWVAENEGKELRLDQAGPTVTLDDRDWRQASVEYAAGKRPLLVEVTDANDGVDDLLAEEVAEFVDALDDVPASPQKEKVRAVLDRTRAIVSAQVLADAEDDGLAAAAGLLLFYAQSCDGMVQADGTGFFEGDDLVLELD